MGFQDADAISAEVNAQLGERGLPEAGLWVLMKSLEDSGNSQLAQFYFAELMQLLIQKMGGQIPAVPSTIGPEQMGPPTGADGMGPQPPMEPPMEPPMGPPMGPPMEPPMGPPTFAPQVAPNAMVGMPPPPPNAQAGPLVPPGTPRPGALARLRAAIPRIPGLGG